MALHKGYCAMKSELNSVQMPREPLIKSLVSHEGFDQRLPNDLSFILRALSGYTWMILRK